MQPQLSCQGFGIDAEAILIAALFEGDEQLVGNGATKNLLVDILLGLKARGGCQLRQPFSLGQLIGHLRENG
jgi:hypothetical protein